MIYDNADGDDTGVELSFDKVQFTEFVNVWIRLLCRIFTNPGSGPHGVLGAKIRLDTVAKCA